MANGNPQGVTILKPTGNRLTFRVKVNTDPRSLKKGKFLPYIRSVETTDSLLARRRANQISRIISDSRFLHSEYEPPEGTDRIVLKILNLQDGIKELALTAFCQMASGKKGIETIDDIISYLDIPALPSDGLYEDKPIYSLLAYIITIKDEIQDLKSQLGETINELRKVTKDKEGLTAYLAKSGLSISKGLKDITLKDAMENWIKDSEAKRHKKVSMRSHAIEFIESLGITNLNKLTQEHILSFCKDTVYVQLQENKIKISTAREKVKHILSLVKFASNGAIQFNLVENWRKKHLKNNVKKVWYWLERDEVKKLIKGIKSKYFADAAMFQYACGFRPWELRLLKTANVITEKGKTYIYLEPVTHKGKVIQSLKTKQSEGKIEIPKFALPALKRRLKKGDYFLFACDNKELGRHIRLKEGFQKKYKLWPLNAWDVAYRKALKEGAKQVKSIDLDKFDGRTLRRTCGKEILIKTGSLDKAATILRDTPEMVREHYSRLITQDVSTER